MKPIRLSQPFRWAPPDENPHLADARRSPVHFPLSVRSDVWKAKSTTKIASDSQKTSRYVVHTERSIL